MFRLDNMTTAAPIAWPWKSYLNRWWRCIDPSENWVLEVRADKCLPPQDNTGTTTANLDPYVVYFKSNVIPGSSSEHENWKKKKKNGTLGTVSIRLKKVHMVMRWRSGCLNASSSSSSKIFPSFSSEQQCCSSFKHKLTASGIFSSFSQPYHPLYISTIHPRRRPSCSSSILLFLLLQGLITLLSKANIFLHNCLEFLT